MLLPEEEIANSLRKFKSRRDSLLHDDIATFDHNLDRFLEFCNGDSLAKSVLVPLEAKYAVDPREWWTATSQYESKISFPSNPDEELTLRFGLIKSAQQDPNHIIRFGLTHGQGKLNESVELFRTLVVRPFVDDLSHRLGVAADLATPEARAVQAVPLNRIPVAKEVKIFLSHKSIDKPLVHRYYHGLKVLGYDPWLDESNMKAGSNLERELLRGFEESCAAVFFITENFKDQNYLATEVEYAVIQKRKKGKKFAIITLRYTDTSPVPSLLAGYVFRDVSNDLDGFKELLKALPIELGAVRWRADVV